MHRVAGSEYPYKLRLGGMISTIFVLSWFNVQISPRIQVARIVVRDQNRFGRIRGSAHGTLQEDHGSRQGIKV